MVIPLFYEILPVILFLLPPSLSLPLLFQDYYSNPGGQDSFTRQILIDHFRHLSQSRRAQRAEPPPNYDEVVKKEEADEEHQGRKYKRGAEVERFCRRGDH